MPEYIHDILRENLIPVLTGVVGYFATKLKKFNKDLNTYFRRSRVHSWQIARIEAALKIPPPTAEELRLINER